MIPMKKTSQTKQTKKAKVEVIGLHPAIESLNESENNNKRKDMPLFLDCIENFSDIEIKFILMQLNRENMMGRKVTRHELKMIEQEFVLKVISNSPCAEYGSLLKNIIQTKLLNSI
jgi:hypothetical protein